MITIQTQDTISPEAINFVKEEWTMADKVHFGHPVEWKKEKKALVAQEAESIVGVLELTMQAGVMYIDELIIKTSRHGQGIGKMLMQKAEEMARENTMHKIYLDTGASWPAVEFYNALGYIKTGDLPHHLAGQDYVVYSKFL